MSGIDDRQDDFREHTCIECAWSHLAGFHGYCVNRTGGRLGIRDGGLFEWEKCGEVPSACPSFLPLFIRDPNSKITDEQWEAAEERLDNTRFDAIDRKKKDPYFDPDRKLVSKIERWLFRMERGERSDVLYEVIMALPEIEWIPDEGEE